MKPTVYLNGQFWVGVAAWTTAAGRHALRPVLEPEPHDQELWDFVNRQLVPLYRRSLPAQPCRPPERSIQPPGGF